MKLRNLAFACVLALSVIGCSRVPPGHEGVLVDTFGGSKSGAEPVGVGYYWTGPGKDLYLFPTFSQNITWKAEEGHGFAFQTVEGLVVSADIGLTYHVAPDKVDEVFVKYRRGIDEITDTFLRNYIRDALVKEASSLAVESIYGNGKVKLLQAVEDRVKAQVAAEGIIVEKISWISDLKLPPQVTGAINAKIQATQMAQQRENELRQAQAEAAKAVAVARGEADSTLLRAEAEAKAISIRGAALRDNQELVSLTLAEKWNGAYPSTLIIGDDKNQILQLPLAK